jgi:hypothetical protein
LELSRDLIVIRDTQLKPWISATVHSTLPITTFEITPEARPHIELVSWYLFNDR